VMIRGKETTQAEIDRAARMSAEHHNQILGAAKASAKLLGYDPSLIRASTEDHTFNLTGTVRHAAGLAHLATGVITVYPERIYSTDGAVSVTAHEVAHQKYQTVLNALQKEREALWEAERQAVQPAIAAGTSVEATRVLSLPRVSETYEWPQPVQLPEDD